MKEVNYKTSFFSGKFWRINTYKNIHIHKGDRTMMKFEIAIYESIDCNNSDWKEKYKETNDKIQEGLLLFAKWFQHLGW